MVDSIPSHNSLPSGLESALSWYPAEEDSVLQTHQSCGPWQASPASCVILSNVEAPFAVAGTIPLASACSHSLNNGKSPYAPTPGFEEGPLGALRHRGTWGAQYPHSRMCETFAHGDNPFWFHRQKWGILYSRSCSLWLWCFRILDLSEKSRGRMPKGAGVSACGFYPVNLGVLSSPGEAQGRS